MTKLSRSALATQDSTVLLQDNTASDILPSEHRQSNINIHDSFLSLVDDNIDKDADTSLKYLSDPSGAWDSSPTHDLKLVPKIYVDDVLANALTSIPTVSSKTAKRLPKWDDFNNALTNSNFESDVNDGKLLTDEWRQGGGGNTAKYRVLTNDSSLVYTDTDKTGFIWRNSTQPGGEYLMALTTGLMWVYRTFSMKNSTSDFESKLYNTISDPAELNSAWFKRSIVVGDSTSTTAGAIRYNTTTNKHQGYNGSTWNDLY